MIHKILPVQPSVLKPKYPERHRSHLRPPTPGLHGHCPPFLLQVKISLPDERVPEKSKKKVYCISQRILHSARLKHVKDVISIFCEACTLDTYYLYNI